MAKSQNSIKKLFSPPSLSRGKKSRVERNALLRHALTFFSNTLHTKFKRGFIHALRRLNMKTRDFGRRKETSEIYDADSLMPRGSQRFNVVSSEGREKINVAEYSVPFRIHRNYVLKESISSLLIDDPTARHMSSLISWGILGKLRVGACS